MLLLYVALGGAIGAVARYGISGWIYERTGEAFPWGTLAVNLLGCLLLGFALRYLEGMRLSSELRLFVTVGVLGAFTTFSTFSYEAVALLEAGAIGRMFAYTAGSVVLGMLAMSVGMLAATQMRPMRA